MEILACISPTDRRFKNVGEGRGIARLSPMSKCGAWGEAECGLGMPATAIKGGVSIGEGNGIEPCVTLLVSVLDRWTRGGGA